MQKESSLIMCLLFLAMLVNAQNPPIAYPETYKVTTFAMNDSVYTGLAMLNDIAVSLNKDKTGAANMENAWRNVGTLSFGKISQLTEEQFKESAEHYGATIYNFVWHYANSYNDETGLADVVFTKVFLENNEVDFAVDIYVRDGDYTISLSGYME